TRRRRQAPDSNPVARAAWSGFRTISRPAPPTLTLSPTATFGAIAAVYPRCYVGKSPFGEIMAYEILTPSLTEAARIELKSYSVTVPLGSLAIGVDNIHHDVFLSPRFVQASRDYLFDLIRQNTRATYFPGIELRPVKSLDNSGFRKLLSEFLQ